MIVYVWFRTTNRLKWRVWLSFFPLLFSSLSCNIHREGAAIVILREARRKRVAAGKDPMGMASAALYIACLQHNEKITQKNIAVAAGVTEVTVRNRYKALKKQLNLEILD